MQCRVLGCLQSTAIKMKNSAHNVMLNTYTLIVCTVLSFDLFNKLGSWCITRLTNVCAYMSPCVAIRQWYRTIILFFLFSSCFDVVVLYRHVSICCVLKTVFLLYYFFTTAVTASHVTVCCVKKKKNSQIQPHSPLYNPL